MYGLEDDDDNDLDLEIKRIRENRKNLNSINTKKATYTSEVNKPEDFDGELISTKKNVTKGNFKEMIKSFNDVNKFKTEILENEKEDTDIFKEKKKRSNRIIDLEDSYRSKWRERFINNTLF
jgi:hypothetical protein